MNGQAPEERPGQNVFDPSFMSYLQEKGLIGVSRQRPAIVGFGAPAPGLGPVPILGMEDIPIDLKEDLKNDFLGFVRDKGYEVVGELPSKEEGERRLAETTARLRDIYTRRSRATIGPISKETVEAMPIVAPSETARAMGQPTIGPPRPTERAVPYTQLAGEKRAEKTKVTYWKEIGKGFDEILSGDGRGWFRVLRAGPEDSRRFFSQVLDIVGLVGEGKTKEAAGYLAEATATGLTLGIINPEVLDKIDRFFVDKGISGETYMSMAQRRAGLIEELGYQPERLMNFSSAVAMVLPISRIVGKARAIGAAATSVPALQRLITAAIGGGATGVAEVAGRKLAGEPFNLEEDLKKVPPHMLYWGLFEFGLLGIETATKIVDWNLRYGGKIAGTGKYGGYGAAQKIRIETQYAPGRGPTTRTQFTAEELRDIFRRGDPTYAGANKIPNDPSNWERQVYEAITGSAGWREAVRRGWMSPRPIEIPGEPPVVTGRTIHRAGRVAPSIGGEPVPMKPDWGQIFRKGGRPRIWPKPEFVPEAFPAGGQVFGSTPPPPTGAPPPRPATGQPGPSEAPPGGPPPPGSAPPAAGGAPRGGRAEAPPLTDWRNPSRPLRERISMAQMRQRDVFRELADLNNLGEANWSPAQRARYQELLDEQSELQDFFAGQERGRQAPPPPREAPPPPPQEAPPPPPERPPITTPPPAAPPGEKPPIVPPIESRAPEFTDKVYRDGQEFGEVAGIGESILKVKTRDGRTEYLSEDAFNSGNYSLDPTRKIGIEMTRDRFVGREPVEPEEAGPGEREFGSLEEALDFLWDDRSHGNEFLASAARELAKSMYGIEPGQPAPTISKNKLQDFIDEVYARAAELEKGAEIPRPAAAKADEKAPTPRTDTAMRESIDRIKADEGTPEDVAALAKAARRNTRLQAVVEGLKARQRTDLLTGVGSDRALEKQVGWEQRPVALFDLTGVKAANNDPARGYKWTDENIFRPAGSVFRNLGDGRVYRRGGTADEFPFLSGKKQSLESLIKEAELLSEHLNKAGVKHRFVTGRDFADAEKRMAAAKDLETLPGRSSEAVPETLPELEKYIIPGFEEVGAIPGEPIEYLTMTGKIDDAIATLINPKEGVYQVRRVADGRYVRNKKTGFPDHPSRNAAWKAYLEERGSEILRTTSPAEVSERFKRAMEPKDQRARRLWRANQEAQRSRKRVGMPKGEIPKLWNDIVEETGGRGIAPNADEKGEWDVNVPRWLKNAKTGKKVDELKEDLERHRGYNFRDKDFYEQLRKADEEYERIKTRATPDEEAAARAEDQYEDYLDGVKEKYGPLMNEGEDPQAFLDRMAKDAEAAGLDPMQDLNEFMDAALAAKHTKGGTDPDDAPFQIRLISAEEAKSQGLWWPKRTDEFGQPLELSDPHYNQTQGQGPDTYSSGFQIQWVKTPVLSVEGWKTTLKRYSGQIRDEKIIDFLETVERICRETDFYRTGNPQTISHFPPYAWVQYKHPQFTGYTGGRDYHLKALIAMDVTARLIQGTLPPVYRPNFFGVMPIYMKPTQIPGAPPDTVGWVGANYSPATGVMGWNLLHTDQRAFRDPFRMAALMRDQICHEFSHFWEPVHNEAFTTRLGAVHDAMAPAWPHIFQLAEKLVGIPARIDRSTVFISLGPGKGQPVERNVIRIAGQETAEQVARQKENKGDKEFYSIRIKPAPAGRRGGEPGEAGVPDTGRGPELPYPRESEPTRGARPEFGKKPYEWKPPAKGEPEGEFALKAPEEKPPAFSPEDLGAKQRGLGLEEEGPLFKGVAEEKVEELNILREIERLTTGDNFPREWRGNTEQEILDNRQNLARFVVENHNPKMGPLENYINANKRFFIRGESKRRALERMRSGEAPMPPRLTGEEKTVFQPESEAKYKPVGAPEVPDADMKNDLFGGEEIKVLNALRSAAKAHNEALGGDAWQEDMLLDILKGRLMSDTPESFDSIAGRIEKSREYVRKQYYDMLNELKDSAVVKEIMARRMKQANLGPIPSERDLVRLAKIIRKYFSSYRGADKTIDQMNDQRIGKKLSEVFDQTLDSQIIKKFLDSEPAEIRPTVEAYATEIMTGAGPTGNAYLDIMGAAFPQEVKEAMLRTRDRIDRLSEMIMVNGGLSEETIAVFEGNLGKYMTKSYRLWEDKRWSPTPEQKAGFKRYLMDEYNMTDAEAETFMEAELAYGRNDDAIRPRQSRRSRRVPTENYIRRIRLTPEWKAFAGEIDRLPWLTLNTVTKQATMAANARFLKWIREYLPDHFEDTYEAAARRGWQNSQLPPHNYAYGELAGKWVDPELGRYIKREFDVSRSDIEEAIQRFLMNPFKWTKTIGSIPAQIRNALSNIGLSLLSRSLLVNPANLKWYIKSWDIHMNRTGSQREAWAGMIKEGVTGTQYYGEEVPKVRRRIMRFDDDNFLGDMIEDIFKWPIDKLGEAYNLGDSIYRVAAYLKYTEAEGMAPAKAVEELNMSLQNYRKMPIVVDVLRRWPVLGPFISFKANVVKIIYNQARTGAEEMRNPATRGKGMARLFRLALFLSIPTILSEVSKQLFDVDEQDIKDLQRFFPEYRRNGTFVYFRGKEDQLKIFDLSFVFPTGDIERMVKASFRGDIQGLTDALDFFSHPLFDIWNIAIKGQDPQWGMKYRTIVDRAVAAAQYLYLPASMPIPNLRGIVEGDLRPGKLTGVQFKAIIDAFNQQPDKYGRVKKLPEEVKNFFTGIRTWDVEPDKLLAQAAVVRNAEIRELQRELGGWLVRNSKAPQWEKDAKKAETMSQIESLAAELSDIGRLSKELKRDDFAVRKSTKR